MTRPRDFPDLAEGEYAVARAETSTGHVLSLAGTWAADGDETYEKFSSIEEAQARAQLIISSNPEEEALILDHTGRVLETVRDPDWRAKIRRPAKVTVWNRHPMPHLLLAAVPGAVFGLGVFFDSSGGELDRAGAVLCQLAVFLGFGLIVVEGAGVLMAPRGRRFPFAVGLAASALVLVGILWTLSLFERH